jgi:hypothetical protein
MARPARWFLVIALLSLSAGPAGAVIRAGAAKVDITPRLPTPYNLGFSEIATKVGHRLFARVLYLEDADDRLVLVATDWEGLLRTADEAARAAVAKAAGVAPGRVVVNASHSHNSMWINLDLEDILARRGLHLVERDYFEKAVRDIAEGARRAARDRQPVRLSVGSGRLNELSFNRRARYVKQEDRDRFNRKRKYPVGVTDPTLGLLRVETMAGKPLAVLHVFAAHATVGAGAGVISGDYPGAAMAEVERRLGGGCVALFFQGCAGNMSPGTGRPGGTVDAVESAGNVLARKAVEVLRKDMKAVAAGDFSVGVKEAKLPLVPLKDFGDLKNLQKQFDDALARYAARKKEGKPPGDHGGIVALGDRLTLARNLGRWSTYPVRVFLCGPVCVVFLPGETCVEYALDIREKAGVPFTFVSAYNDCTPVYVPDPVAFEEGGYEVGPWCYSTPETGGVLVRTSLEVIAGLRKGRSP